MPKEFEDKVALVTGAGSGIGLATARAFAEAGASVALADKDEESALFAADQLIEAGHKALGIECDVADEQQVAAMIERTLSNYGRLDAACNNAGIHVQLADTSEAAGEDFDRLMAINLRGVWNCMKHELRAMLRQGSGAIVNVSSQSGIAGIAGLGAYTASKHGVLGLTKSAALEYAAKGIRVNAVCPGSVLTPMVERALASHPESMNKVIQDIPLGRLGGAEEIAAAVLWLCGPAASFVIGHALVVDGGYTAR
jgi:NAD(P)-dependent dehydrogenase (short-subunit alcohol dehydrogenase family)